MAQWSGVPQVKPVTEIHNGITVVRDDLYVGGTKARFIPQLFDDADEVVYASPAEGGAQFALASVAKLLGKRATIFAADRAEPHPRQLEARRLGAKVVLVRPGYLNVVQARARAYCDMTGARLAPFVMDLPDAVDCIAAAARLLPTPDEVWCAAGSGTLMRALAQAWPKAARHAVQVGRGLSADEVAGARIHVFPKPFAHAAACPMLFPSDPHYDVKAYMMCEEATRPYRSRRRVLLWSVCGPPEIMP